MRALGEPDRRRRDQERPLQPPNKELAINRKTPLDRESPIQVRIHSAPAESRANHRFLSGDRPIQSPAVRRSPELRCEISHTAPLRFLATCDPASFEGVTSVGLVQRSSLTDGACPRHLSNTSDPAAEILAHHVQAGGLFRYEPRLAGTPKSRRTPSFSTCAAPHSARSQAAGGVGQFVRHRR